MKNSIITECWKPVAGYEGLYEVSDLGNVRSLNYGCSGKVKLLSPKNCRGYLLVALSKNGEKRKFLYIHRLTYEAFIGPIPPGMTVDHINGIKSDNRLENLQLLSRGDNARKAVNKQLDLIQGDWPYTELTFSNSYEASKFFGYPNQSQIGMYIYKARKRGRNFLNLKGKKYFFAQQESEAQATLTKFSELT